MIPAILGKEASRVATQKIFLPKKGIPYTSCLYRGPREQAISQRYDYLTEATVRGTGAKESCYGSPPNFSLTNARSPVSTPAPVRISWNTVSLDTPTSSIDRPLWHTMKYMDTLFYVVLFLVSSSSHETFVKQNRWFGGRLSQNQSKVSLG